MADSLGAAVAAAAVVVERVEGRNLSVVVHLGDPRGCGPVAAAGAAAAAAAAAAVAAAAAPRKPGTPAISAGSSLSIIHSFFFNLLRFEPTFFCFSCNPM